MKAIVMAGGEGTRLRPLTSRRPKPLVPVMNRPIMEHIILLLKQHGITDIVVTLYYLGDEISGYFGRGEDWGVRIEYVTEESPLGTAGAVRQAADVFRDSLFSSYLEMPSPISIWVSSSATTARKGQQPPLRWRMCPTPASSAW